MNRVSNIILKKIRNAKRGSVTTETILLIAIAMVIVVTIFYPQIRAIVVNTLNSLSEWYDRTLVNLGI